MQGFSLCLGAGNRFFSFLTNLDYIRDAGSLSAQSAEGWKVKTMPAYFKKKI